MNVREFMEFLVSYFDDAEDLPAIAIKVWMEEIKVLSPSQLDHLANECCKLPKGASIYPARLLEMVGHAPEEQQAWDSVQSCLHQGTLEGLTPAAYSACREIGMTCRWRHIENRELPQLKKQFIEAVKGYLSGAKTLFNPQYTQNALPPSEQSYMSDGELKQRIAAFKAEQQAIKEEKKRQRMMAIIESFQTNLQRIDF
ncbi:MAG: hypothetical protein WBA77_00430 [Microcoleaceae cyanobacterium]